MLTKATKTKIVWRKLYKGIEVECSGIATENSNYKSPELLEKKKACICICTVLLLFNRRLKV